jgi:D-amino-acid dehydrogenase
MATAPRFAAPLVGTQSGGPAQAAQKNVAVIGAGIIGIAIAHALLDEGHSVLLIDKGQPGAATSRGNAGIIAHTDILPLASPDMIGKVAGWMLDPLGPLAIRPQYIPKLMPWLARFLLASRPSAVERSIKGIVPLQALSMAAWDRRLAALDLKGELNHRGVLYCFDNAREFEKAKTVYDRQRDLGIEVQLFDRDGTQELEPELADTFVGSALFPAVAHVNDPFELSQKLAASLRQRGAAVIERDVRGVGLDGESPWIASSDGSVLQADHVVIALGAWSTALAKALGDTVPLDTERGYNATMTDPGVKVTRPMLFDGHGFAITPLKTGLRVGGAVELASVDAPPNWARVEALLKKAKSFVPSLKQDGRKDWMGCRPSLPDSLPVISRSRATPRVLYAFGHAHHGLTQAAATAELIAAMIAGRETAIDVAPYSAQRF